MDKTNHNILSDLFYIIIGGYVFLLLLEKLKPGIISNHLDLNKILYIIVPLAVLIVIFSNKKKKPQKISNEPINNPPEPPHLPDNIKK